MIEKEEPHRFVILIEKDMFKKFQKLAKEKEGRSASNLAAKMVRDYVTNNN